MSIGRCFKNQLVCFTDHRPIGLLNWRLGQGQPLTYPEEKEDGIQLLCDLKSVFSLIPPGLIRHYLMPSHCAITDRVLNLVAFSLKKYWWCGLYCRLTMFPNFHSSALNHNDLKMFFFSFNIHLTVCNFCNCFCLAFLAWMLYWWKFFMSCFWRCFWFLLYLKFSAQLKDLSKQLMPVFFISFFFWQ